MDISFANQLFINGEFVNATSGKKQKLYNPHDESVICEVSVLINSFWLISRNHKMNALFLLFYFGN